MQASSLDTKVDTMDSSRLSYDSMGVRVIAGKMAEILDIVVHCHREGLTDLSLSEIQQAYEAKNGKRIDLNRVSARVYDLVQAKKLERIEQLRPCKVTGRRVHPVKAIAQQARLAA
jgi:hypothetical protein